jgi:hypothetical protein
MTPLARYALTSRWLSPLAREVARARRWGMTLGAVSRTYLPAPA